MQISFPINFPSHENFHQTFPSQNAQENVTSELSSLWLNRCSKCHFLYRADTHHHNHLSFHSFLTKRERKGKWIWVEEKFLRKSSKQIFIFILSSIACLLACSPQQKNRKNFSSLWMVRKIKKKEKRKRGISWQISNRKDNFFKH